MAKAKPYSSEVCLHLAEIAEEARLYRPRRVARHEAGERLVLDLTGVAPAWRGRATFEIERYVGGGFAGQVYRARVVGVEGDAAAKEALPTGGAYALKMFVPWSRFARVFRDGIYALAFQAPFGLQGNPSAVRAAALWQKFLRRGARVRMGEESAIVDVHATFFDEALGSHGQVLEWVEGRVWWLEVNERLFSKVPPDAPVPETEYAAKKRFMSGIVGLFHEMGAPELARQYAWWTMKSQPNVLKRISAGPPRGEAAGEDPAAGLVAVDFGAGLALLPFLPMSPGDFSLILQGLAAGRLVQFDRGDLVRLEAFVSEHASAFADLSGALAELRIADTAYRRSQADLTHHHIHLLADGDLRRSIREGWIASYRARGRMDEAAVERFRRNPIRTWLYVLLGLVPLLGRFVQRLWGSAAYRRHVGAMLSSLSYLRRALRARQAELLMEWHRRGRASAERTKALLRYPALFWIQAATVAFLPPGVHQFLTDRRYVRDVFVYLVVRPVKLYFNAVLRRQWLCDMIAEGRAEGMLTPAEAGHLEAQVEEPYIQKYLKALAVHLCTLFVSETVVGLLILYALIFWARTWDEALAYAVGIFIIVNASPVSPGALVRGVYVLSLMIRERRWREYAVAAPLSFLKMIGYLAFPIQMVFRYPVLARFMAARWATQAVGLVPVFGEHGALLEHGVFNTFFNVPISLRQRWQEMAPDRARLRGPIGWVGTCLGVGHLVGMSGTYTSAVTAGLLLAAFYLGAPLWAVAAAAAAAVAVGIPVAGWFERRLERKDPRSFVLDEVAGMLIAGLAAYLATGAAAWASVAAALVWFRVCDIWKPPPIRQLERLSGGWGVVLDDVVAGAMALALALATMWMFRWAVG